MMIIYFYFLPEGYTIQYQSAISQYSSQLLLQTSGVQKQSATEDPL